MLHSLLASSTDCFITAGAAVAAEGPRGKHCTAACERVSLGRSALSTKSVVVAAAAAFDDDELEDSCACEDCPNPARCIRIAVFLKLRMSVATSSSTSRSCRRRGEQKSFEREIRGGRRGEC